VRGRVSSVFFVARDAGFMVGMAAAGLADLFDVRLLVVISALVLLACGALALILPGIGQPSAEWRHMLAMLRAGPTAPGLGLGRAALAADIDRLSLRLPALEHLERVRTVVLCYSQSMPKNASVAAVSGLLYRAMQRDEESGLPHVGPSSRRLGVRTGTGFATDIPVDRRGWVRPGTGGMSVAIDDPMNLHELRRPRILPGGRGKDPVWSIGPDHLGAKLVFRRDPYAPTRHGFIEPAEPMPLVRYEEELARTRANWSLVVSIG
jgi:hypothetical protein